MNFLNDAGSKFFAAFGSLAFSAIIFAAAIAPANSGAILPGVMA